MDIVGISGSLRQASLNTKLLKAAAVHAHAEGSSMTILDISEVPLYNGDIDGEIKPEPVQRLIQAITDSDGLLLATPEYNYSLSGVLKNALDWASRPAYKSCLAKRPTGIISASMSPLGGVRAQIHLRDVLAGVLTPVFNTPDYLLGSAHQAFNDDGELVDEKAQERLQRYVRGFIEWAGGNTA